MAFYDLTKEQRVRRVEDIHFEIIGALKEDKLKPVQRYFADGDTYIRKAAYLAFGRIYFSEKIAQARLIRVLNELMTSVDFKVRQTVINTAGEIGKKEFEPVQHFFDAGLFDPHHSPRNAVIGSIKKMGEVNPRPVLSWARKYLHHADKEIRREICHGIELRGRKYPQDILPMLQELEHDKTARVRNTLIHVIGQIAYKKDCLKTVIEHLKKWQNKQLVKEALEEVIDVHHRYRNFAAMTQEEARRFIVENF